MSEIELKFEVSADDLKQLARHPAMAAAPERVALSTIYYDTPDGDLRAAGLSLRVRRKGKRFTQTLKRTRSAELFDRDEWEAETNRFAPNLSLLAHTPVAELLTDHALELRPQFSLRIDRALRLVREEEAEIEISVDKGEVRAGESTDRILELELELKSGAPERLYAFAKQLLEVAPIRLSFDTKSDRGHRLVSGAMGDARKAEALQLTPDMTAAIAFRCIARSCLVQLAGNGQALHRARRPETLHQARIALRRLRSGLTVFKPLLNDEAFEAVRAELKWAAGALDEARELDVFIARLQARPDEGELLSYLERLTTARERAYDAGLAALDSPRFAKMLLDTALWVETGAWSRNKGRTADREQPIADFAAKVLDKRRKRVRKAGQGLVQQDAAGRHQLRIECKKLRYAAEFFENAFPKAGKRRAEFIEKLKGLQDELGALNDIAMAPEIARQGVFGRGVADLAFVAGQVVGELRADEPELIAGADKAFRRFMDAKTFW